MLETCTPGLSSRYACVPAHGTTAAASRLTAQLRIFQVSGLHLLIAELWRGGATKSTLALEKNMLNIIF
jgi:hypothetical protein